MRKEIAESPYLTDEQKERLQEKAHELQMELDAEAVDSRRKTEEFQGRLQNAIEQGEERRRQARDNVEDWRTQGAEGTEDFGYSVDSEGGAKFHSNTSVRRRRSIRQIIKGGEN